MIKIYTFAVNRPDFLHYQHRTFQHFLKDEHRIIVINDGHGGDSDIIKRAAESLNLECHSVPDQRQEIANYAHARSLKFTYDNLVVNDDDISVMLDGDMFMGRNFSIRNWMEDYSLSALKQSRAHVEYLWPGLTFINMKGLPNKTTLNFWPDQVDGHSVDVGGHTYEFIRDNPTAKVKWMRHSGQIMEQSQNLQCLPEALLPNYQSEFCIEIYLSAFIHYHAGTNWNYKPQEFHAAKTAFVFNMLEQCMNGSITLPCDADHIW